MNPDPSGAPLYLGQATTELCPTTSFDDEPLYPDAGPDAMEIKQRKARWFTTYHAAIAAEVARLRVRHPGGVVYDAHSTIRPPVCTRLRLARAARIGSRARLRS